MTDFHHTRCDWCESAFCGEAGQVVQYPDLAEAGWFELVVGYEAEDDRVLTLDFCSKRCLVAWALVEQVGAEDLARLVGE